MDGGVINFWGLKLFTFVPANNLTNSQFTASCFDWFNRMRVLWACGYFAWFNADEVVFLIWLRVFLVQAKRDSEAQWGLKSPSIIFCYVFCRWKGANFLFLFFC
ncbi:hypothetical protein HanPI659440_Chr00c10g0722091 [Helianthus annuus]|nr:hypothetical protein HanPI659440_Chr00c10g0722091 [Helianthus annuus]